MKPVSPRQLFAAALVAFSATVVAAPTTRCNPTPWVFELVLEHSGQPSQVVDSVIAAARNPASNPELYERLWRPTTVRVSGAQFPMVILGYEPIQDIEQIAAELRNDAIAPSFRFIYPNATLCGTPPPPVTVEVTEYYNITLNHYFLSSSPGENAAIDSGAAGPGWARTGRTWLTHQPDPCSAPDYKPVYRFYGTPGIGPNSHFFTVNPDECGGLRRGVGWGFEGFAFGAALPANGQCPVSAPAAMLRLYNNRWMQNDSNHRYTSNIQIYNSMQGQGWIGEGVQLCVRQVGN